MDVFSGITSLFGGKKLFPDDVSEQFRKVKDWDGALGVIRTNVAGLHRAMEKLIGEIRDIEGIIRHYRGMYDEAEGPTKDSYKKLVMPQFKRLETVKGEEDAIVRTIENFLELEKAVRRIIIQSESGLDDGLIDRVKEGVTVADDRLRVVGWGMEALGAKAEEEKPLPSNDDVDDMFRKYGM